MVHQIGFSCGVLYRLQKNGIDRFSSDAMVTFVAAGAQSIELMCHDIAQLTYLSPEIHEYISTFSHISVHAPAYPYDDDAESHALLRQLA